MQVHVFQKSAVVGMALLLIGSAAMGWAAKPSAPAAKTEDPAAAVMKQTKPFVKNLKYGRCSYGLMNLTGAGIPTQLKSDQDVVRLMEETQLNLTGNKPKNILQKKGFRYHGHLANRTVFIDELEHAWAVSDMLYKKPNMYYAAYQTRVKEAINSGEPQECFTLLTTVLR